MKYLKWIVTSLLHHRRRYLPVLLGILFTSSLLTGALMVGDSVRFTLKKFLMERLGQIHSILVRGAGFVEARLAGELAEETGIPIAPLSLHQATAVKEGGALRLNGVQVLGIDDTFWQLSPGAFEKGFEPPESLSPGEAYINISLAKRMDLKDGDNFLIRIPPVSLIPYDLPFIQGEEKSVNINLRVKAVLDSSHFGNFNLKSGQQHPYNLFLDLGFLQERLETGGRVNRILAGGDKNNGEKRLIETVNNLLRPEDLGLRLSHYPEEEMFELKSDRIFMDSSSLSFPGSASPVLTYFVNRISFGNRSTPYSFISADGKVSVDLGPDEMVITDWLAEDLGVKLGDDLRLDYYINGEGNILQERSRSFRIREIIPGKGGASERALMPSFPGVAEADNCRDWEPGIPIDLEAVREKDEEYWDLYRGSPKGYVSLEAARQMWANRFGDTTSVRFYGLSDSPETEILETFNKEGIHLQSILEEGEFGVANSIDFGGLFLGLSFFLILGALLLTGLLFLFSLENEREEMGLLLSLGYSRPLTSTLFLMRGAFVALLGSLIGVFPGMLYNRLILAALSSIWKDAVNTSYLVATANPLTLAISILASFLTAFLVLALFSRKLLRQEIILLLRSGSQENEKRSRFPGFLAAILSFCAVVILMILALTRSEQQAVALFFLCGTIMLFAVLSFYYGILEKWKNIRHGKTLSLKQVALHNLGRRRKRNMFAAGLLACSFFLVLAVGLNKKTLPSSLSEKSSPTGGYQVYGELSIPLDVDLSYSAAEAGLEAFKDAEYLSFRVHDGEDASCLNLNRVNSPRLLGVNPELLAERDVFSFASVNKGAISPWRLLAGKTISGKVPGFVDETVMLWGLGLSVGDSLTYTGEDGQSFEIELVGALADTIFQGSILISEESFLNYFPSESGYGLFLAKSQEPDFQRKLEELLRNRGALLQDTKERLREFNKVENAYLSVFLILGGMGILLGSIGMGILLLRKIMEERKELALLWVIGYEKRIIYRMVIFEQIAVLFGGMGAGILAAVTGLLPSLLRHGEGIPVLFVLILTIAILVNGVLWISLLTRGALKGESYRNLRND